MRKHRWNMDPFLVAVIVVGIAVFTIKCMIVYPIQWMGDTDEAAYIEMADNLIHGKGFSNDYIQYSYFLSRLRYPEITHPDAHYAPLYSLLIVPFFLALGKSAFAAKLPAMLMGSIFVPVSVYLLTGRLSRSRIPAFAAAMGAAFFPLMFSHSLIPDDDVLFVFMVLITCFFIIKAQDAPMFFSIAGIFIGLTYYAKGTGLWLIPVYLVFCVIAGGFRILRSPKVWACFAIAFFVMLPWFVRNTIHFRNPIFSTQQYAAGYIGYKEWEEGTYTLYWDRDMPSLFSKLREAGFREVTRKTWRFYREYLWWAFMDINGLWDEFEAKNFVTYYTGIPAILGLLLFFLSCLYSLVTGSSVKMAKFLMAWHNRDLHVLWLISFSLMTFLAICWEPIQRLALPFALINIAIGWTTYHTAAGQIFARIRHSHVIVTCLILILIIPVLLKSVGEIYNDYKEGDFPYGEDGESWMEAGKWIRENLPGSVVMFREPGQLHFYSEEKGVQIPLARLDQIIKVMKFYKVTHIIPWVSLRPALMPLAAGVTPGFKLVYDGGLKIYEIQYDLLPPEASGGGYGRKDILHERD